MENSCLSNNPESNLRERISAIRETIATAAEKSGRRAEDIELVAVSKGQPTEAIRQAYACGLRIFAENYVKEAIDKWTGLSDLSLELDFVGHLQTNKVRQIIPFVRMIQSADSIRLVDEIHKRTAAQSTTSILLQCNIAAEEQKSGTSTEELKPLLDHLATLPNIVVKGLMFIPPISENPEDSRSYFYQLKKIHDKIRQIGYPLGAVLSMGMSDDYRYAIEEGSTMIRLGTALFGPRQPKT